MTILSTPETLMSKFSNEFYKNKQDMSNDDVSWRLKNAEENIEYLSFVLNKAVQELEKLQKAPQGHLTK